MGAKWEAVMKLNVLERLLCNALLPAESNFATLKLIRKAREALSFTEEENKTLQFESFKDDDGQEKTRWNQQAMIDIGEADIKLGVTPVKEIAKALKALEDKDELKDEHISLYEKFIEADPVAEIEASAKIAETEASQEEACDKVRPIKEEPEPEQEV
jgi:hypothetical protein